MPQVRAFSANSTVAPRALEKQGPRTDHIFVAAAALIVFALQEILDLRIGSHSRTLRGILTSFHSRSARMVVYIHGPTARMTSAEACI